MTDQMTGHEIEGHEIAGHEIAGDENAGHEIFTRYVNRKQWFRCDGRPTMPTNSTNVEDQSRVGVWLSSSLCLLGQQAY